VLNFKLESVNHDGYRDNWFLVSGGGSFFFSFNQPL